MEQIERKFREDFVSTNKLPIKIIDSPWFEYFLDLYEGLYQSRTKWETLNNELKARDFSFGKYLNLLHDLRNEITLDIYNNPAFETFKNLDLAQFRIPSDIRSKNLELYRHSMKDKLYLSVDMKEANFQALRYINPEIVKNTNSWTEFVGLFTDIEELKKDKESRQKILGKLEPKTQQSIELFLMYHLSESITGLKLVGFKSDEIICEVEPDQLPHVDVYIQEVQKRADKMGVRVKCELFKLRELRMITHNGYEHTGYIKHYYYPVQQDTIHAVFGHYFPQFFKYWKNLELEEKDLNFIFDDQVARFQYPLKPM